MLPPDTLDTVAFALSLSSSPMNVMMSPTWNPVVTPSVETVAILSETSLTVIVKSLVGDSAPKYDPTTVIVSLGLKPDPVFVKVSA